MMLPISLLTSSLHSRCHFLMREAWGKLKNLNCTMRFLSRKTLWTSKPGLKVVDGGFLLHRVNWHTGITFESIASQYLAYVKSHFGECAVVFDKYDDSNSTKRAEQKRRNATKTAVDRNFDVQQERFFANRQNKAKLIRPKLIHLLLETLMASGVEATVAPGDAEWINTHWINVRVILS